MARRARQAVLFLALGAIVNVLVSWGCAAWLYAGVATRVGTGAPLGSPDGSWYLASYRPPGTAKVRHGRPVQVSISALDERSS